MTDNLAAEVTRATEAETTNTETIAAETTRAKAAEGDLDQLSTTVKTNLVAAINEVKANSNNGGGSSPFVYWEYNSGPFTFSAAAAFTKKIEIPSAYIGKRVLRAIFSRDFTANTDFSYTNTGIRLKDSTFDFSVDSNFNVIIPANYSGRGIIPELNDTDFFEFYVTESRTSAVQTCNNVKVTLEMI